MSSFYVSVKGDTGYDNVLELTLPTKPFMIEIIDNFVDESFSKKILEMCSLQEYEKNIKTTEIIEYDIHNKFYEDKRIHDHGQECCILANNDIINKEKEIVNYLIDQAKKYLPNIKHLRRIKINKIEKRNNIPKEHFNTPHFDLFDVLTTTHYSMIYYCNDSDGDTYLFNEFFNPFEDPRRLTVCKKITPKRGRAVIFESARWHASSNPIENDERIVINFVFGV